MKMVTQFLIFMSKVGVTDIDLLYPLTLVSCVGQRHLFAICRLSGRVPLLKTDQLQPLMRTCFIFPYYIPTIVRQWCALCAIVVHGGGLRRSFTQQEYLCQERLHKILICCLSVDYMTVWMWGWALNEKKGGRTALEAT